MTQRPRLQIVASAMKRPEIQGTFLLFSFGLLFTILMPPFEIADEPQHFFRVYQIAQGDLLAERRQTESGGEIPSSLKETVHLIRDDIYQHPGDKQIFQNLKKAFRIPLNPYNTEFVSFSGSAIYNPIPYFPQLLGVLMGKWLDLPPIMLLYLGRVSNLLFGIIAVGLSIFLLPLQKNTLFLLALMPMSVHQFASLSPDCAAIGLSFLLLALILRISLDPDAMVEAKTVSGLVLLTALLASSKSVYFPLAFLTILIPVHKFRNRIRYILVAGTISGISIGLFFIWGSVSQAFIVTHLRGGVPFGMGKLFILSHPFYYLDMVFRNLSDNLPFYIHSFVGMLGWLNIEIPLFLVIFYCASLIVVSVLDGDQTVSLSWPHKASFAMVFLMCIFLVITSQYFIWTLATSMDIGKAQGRYFIPIAPLVFLILHSRRLGRAISGSAINLFSSLLAMTTLLFTCWIIAQRYYF